MNYAYINIKIIFINLIYWLLKTLFHPKFVLISENRLTHYYLLLDKISLINL